MKKLMILLFLTVTSVSLFAQDAGVVAAETFLTAEFFAAVFAGLVLALAFQLILTNLTAAAGLSAAKAVTEKSPGKRTSSSTGSTSGEKASDKVYSALRKVNAGFGLWTIITTSISLFFASWLALALTGLGVLGITFGIVTGLVIWGLSYLITTTLELSAGASMVGAITGVAKDSMRTLSDTTSSLFARSEAKQDAKSAAAITDAVKNELFGHTDLKRQINDYIKQLKPDYGPRDFRRELASLLDNIEIESFISEDSGPGGVPEVIREIKTSSDTMDREKARSAASSIREAVRAAKEERSSGKRESDQASDAAMRATGMSPEEAEETRHKIEEYLRNTGKEELNPEGIKRDLEKLFHDPKGGTEALKRRLSQFDRTTAVAALEQRQSMSHQDAERTVDRVMDVVDQIVGRSKETAGAAQARASSTQTAVKERAGSTKEQALGRLEGYLASLETDSPTLDPEAVRQEVELLFHDPRAGADALYHRAKNLNREDVIAIVSSNRHISREDAERTADQIMVARDRTIERTQQMRQEVEHRIEQARDEAMHQADQTRKTFASAAWWIFTSALISGVAAALGGMIGTIL